MASQWYSLVSQKLFLAKHLLDMESAPGADDNAESGSTQRRLQQEATLQGALELMLRARRLMLTMIARFHQVRNEQPGSLEELTEVIGEDSNDAARLHALAGQTGSWWNHLDQLERSQSNPPATRKTISQDNIIAVSAEAGPDRSVNALARTLGEMKQFADDLEEQNSEW